MSTDLSPSNEQFIENALASGAFGSRDELLDAAVELLRERREEIRRMIQAGVEELDRGEGIPAEQVFAELEKKAAKIVREARGKKK
jgi:antitoxin ParD1/3/4